MAELAWIVLGKHPQLGLTATTVHDVTSSSPTADAVMPPAGPDTTAAAAPAAPSASVHRSR
ncbi:hypothetical protein ACIO6T_26340 [Streptomyces sp. NPDC087532]|uniref:hypothetical protein n=1 Tax=Streptomyces sp. NPDC087532 TaxID=3365795 RepID=UPI0038021D01